MDGHRTGVPQGPGEQNPAYRPGSPSSTSLNGTKVPRTVFAAAVDDRLIGHSPCVKISLPKRDDTEVEPLRVEEVEALAGALPHRYRAIVMFAAGMGLRQGECLGLTVDRVDFLRRQVRVDRQMPAVSNGEPVFGPPKTRASVRTVPMPSVITDLLAAVGQSFGEYRSLGRQYVGRVSVPVVR